MSCAKCRHGNERREHLSDTTQPGIFGRGYRGGWESGTVVRCSCGQYWMQGSLEFNEYDMHRVPRLIVWLIRRGELKRHRHV